MIKILSPAWQKKEIKMISSSFLYDETNRTIRILHHINIGALA